MGEIHPQFCWHVSVHEISQCTGSVTAELQPSREASQLEKWDSPSPTFVSCPRQEGSFRQLWKLQQLLNRGPSKDQYWKVLFLDLGNQNKAWIEQMHFWIKLLHSIFHWAKEMVLFTMGAEERRMKAATQPSGINHQVKSHFILTPTWTHLHHRKCYHSSDSFNKVQI